MNKKAQMICLIPAVVAAFAVMVYCFAANVGGDAPLLYALGTMLAIFLVMYLLVGRRISKKEAAKEKRQAVPAARQTPDAPVKVYAGDQVDLRAHLTGEEIRILLSDLQTASGKVPADQKAALDALASQISLTGSIHAKALPVCVSAVEMGLGVFSAFSLAPAGHTALLEKLRKLEEQLRKSLNYQ